MRNAYDWHQAGELPDRDDEPWEPAVSEPQIATEEEDCTRCAQDWDREQGIGAETIDLRSPEEKRVARLEHGREADHLHLARCLETVDVRFEALIERVARLERLLLAVAEALYAHKAAEHGYSDKALGGTVDSLREAIGRGS